MPIRRARWIVLGEDSAHVSFMLTWLKARNVPRSAVTDRPPPAGRGAGEQFVRERLPVELRALRRRRDQAIILIVVTDADVLPVDERIATLGDDIADEHERLVLLIPRRNIQTWIAYLHDEPVDEVTDYKQRFRDGDACRVAARRLAALGELPAGAPDSLRRAFGELARLRVP